MFLQLWVCRLLAVVIFTSGSASFAQEEECDFDQAEQLRNMQELQRKYPGSRYHADAHQLRIPEGNDTVILAIGGCVHYGVYIELQRVKTRAWDDEQALMKEILRLVRRYSQGLIDAARLAKVIAAKDWTRLDADSYYLNYEDAHTTEIYRKEEDGQSIIGISDYL